MEQSDHILKVFVLFVAKGEDRSLVAVAVFVGFALVSLALVDSVCGLRKVDVDRNGLAVLLADDNVGLACQTLGDCNGAHLCTSNSVAQCGVAAANNVSETGKL